MKREPYRKPMLNTEDRSKDLMRRQPHRKSMFSVEEHSEDLMRRQPYRKPMPRAEERSEDLMRMARYPVKYALLPIREFIGIKPQGAPDYAVVAFLVQKCFVIKEGYRNMEDGSISGEYEVLFPYVQEGDGGHLEWNLSRIYGRKVTKVNSLFESFDEASDFVSKRYDAFNKKVANSRFSISYDHLARMDKYKKIENELEKYLADVAVTRISSMDEILRRMDEVPESFYSRIYNALSEEERAFLTRLLAERRCTNCTNKNCPIKSVDEVESGESGKIQDTPCESWLNEELIGKEFILRMRHL